MVYFFIRVSNYLFRPSINFSDKIETINKIQVFFVQNSHKKYKRFISINFLRRKVCKILLKFGTLKKYFKLINKYALYEA